MFAVDGNAKIDFDEELDEDETKGEDDERVKRINNRR